MNLTLRYILPCLFLLLGARTACADKPMESHVPDDPNAETTGSAKPPLTLRLQAQKTRFLVGEGIVFDLLQEVHADLSLETVELNADRTRLYLTALDETDDEGRPMQRILSGADYVRLHHAARLEPVGTAFDAEADSSWTSLLELFLYTRALPAGRYRLALSYRYGDTGEAVVRSNEVDFEVMPARVRSIAYRWFGGRHARDELASVWTAEAGGSAHWFYQVASKHDPGAVRVATDLDVGDLKTTSPPQLALLNDIAAMHFERYVVWTQPEGLGWMKVQLRGRLTEPAVAAHGLATDPAPRVLPPALQRVDGGLDVLLEGVTPAGAPSFSLVEIDAQGHARHRLLPVEGSLEGRAVVVWTGEEGSPAAWVYRTRRAGDASRSVLVRRGLGEAGEEVVFTAAGTVEALASDQWLGSGHVGLLLRTPEGLRTAIVAADPSTTPAQTPVEWPRQQFGDGRLIDDAMLDGGAGLALLFATQAGVRLFVPGEEGWQAPEMDKGDPVALVATPRAGVFVVASFGDDMGLRALSLQH